MDSSIAFLVSTFAINQYAFPKTVLGAKLFIDKEIFCAELGKNGIPELVLIANKESFEESIVSSETNIFTSY